VCSLEKVPQPFCTACLPYICHNGRRESDRNSIEERERKEVKKKERERKRFSARFEFEAAHMAAEAQKLLKIEVSK
jgi:hypothetical protein